MTKKAQEVEKIVTEVEDTFEEPTITDAQDYLFLNVNDGDAENLDDLLERIDPKGVRISAADLVDQMFYLLKIRPFASRLNEGGTAYFVVGRLVADDTLFNSILGGVAVVDVLNILMKSEIRNRVVMMLQFVEGGGHSGYYILSGGKSMNMTED